MNKKQKQIFDMSLSVLLPLILGALIVILWQEQVFHSWLKIKVLQLPLPSRIMNVFFQNFNTLWIDIGITLRTAICGLAIGSSLGFCVAVIATINPKWGYSGLAVLSAFNAIPIVALSPIMNVWFSTSPELAKIAVVSIVCMVAMAVNAYRGMTDLPPFSQDLMKSYAASKFVIFYNLRLQNAVPSIFTGLRINVANAMIGAIISEYFSQASNGLGFGIRNKITTGQFPLGWAYIIAASLVGIALYMVVSISENCALKHRIK